MSLSSGIYIITSNADGANVGRHPIEDRSLHPKPVLALPKEIDPPKFIVEQNDTGYKLKAHGSPLGVYNNQVFAFLLEESQFENWVITAQPQHGKNVYTVEQNDRFAGWIVDNAEGPFGGHFINVKPLIVAPSLPPHFPQNELFTFIRIDREDDE